MIDDLPLLLPRLEPAVATLTEEIAALIAGIAPDLRGTARINWGSVTYQHPVAGFIMTLLPMGDHVALVFEQGARLTSPLLTGTGERTRVARFAVATAVDEAALAGLVAAAIALPPAGQQV
jgi:hypothetical protein